MFNPHCNFTYVGAGDGLGAGVFNMINCCKRGITDFNCDILLCRPTMELCCFSLFCNWFY